MSQSRISKTPWFASKSMLKIFSFFVALSLWFYVLNSDPIEVDKNVEVEFIPPKGFALRSLPPNDLRLRLKGSRTFVENLYGEEEKISIELKPSQVKKKGATNIKLNEKYSSPFELKFSK